MRELDSFRLPKLRGILGALLIVAVAAAGCDQGCEGLIPEREAPEEEPEEEVRELSEDVVAVARLLRFSERHFDLRLWREQGREAGYLKEREDRGHLVEGMPTAEFRLFVEDVLGEVQGGVRWDEHVDVAVWAPKEERGEWRWAVVVPWVSEESLAAQEWPAHGRQRVRGEEGGELVSVYERSSAVGSLDTYYVAEVPMKAAEGSQFRGRGVGISNFPEGPTAVAEAVEQTGVSGRREVELYLWPRRWGIAERYQVAAELMEQHMAMNAHDVLPARVSLLQLHTQIYRAMGRDEAWPEVMRLTLQSHRPGPSEPARRVELTVDVTANQGTLLPALWRTMRETNLHGGPVVEGAVGQVGLVLRPREMADFAEAVLPEAWLQLMSVRGAGTRQLLVREFQEVLLHHRGPTTVAFFESPRPLTGEVFVGWQALDRDMMPAVVNRFLNRFFRDYWMPLHDVREFARRESREEVFAEEEVEIHEMTFVVHGTGEVGVCWVIRGSEFLSYFGARPCDRLREVAEFPEQTRSAPALAYAGSLKGLVDKLFVFPGDSSGDLLEGVDVRFRAQRLSGGRLTVTAEFDDLGRVAQVADEFPRLSRSWAPGAMFEPELFLLYLGLDQATYQEPGLSALAVPGMTGVMPPSFLLGMPFTFPPTSPTLFRRIYLDTGDDADDHDHHHHQ